MNLTLDLNTILTSCVLAILLWQIRQTVDQGRKQAVGDEKHAQTEREMVELRARVAAAEANVAEVSMRVARLEGGAGIDS